MSPILAGLGSRIAADRVRRKPLHAVLRYDPPGPPDVVRQRPGTAARCRPGAAAGSHPGHRVDRIVLPVLGQRTGHPHGRPSEPARRPASRRGLSEGAQGLERATGAPASCRTHPPRRHPAAGRRTVGLLAGRDRTALVHDPRCAGRRRRAPGPDLVDGRHAAAADRSTRPGPLAGPDHADRRA